MTAAHVLARIAALRPANAILVEEAPTARGPIHDHLPIVGEGGFYTTASGGLGYGLPAASGVARAQPLRKVIALLGDGSAMYTIQGLWSAAEQRLPVSFVILNNRRYAALNRFAKVFGMNCLPGTEIGGRRTPADNRSALLFRGRGGEIGVLVGHPVDELAYVGIGEQRLDIHRVALQFGIGEIGDQGLLADRMHRHDIAAAPAFGNGMMPHYDFAGRPPAQPAGHDRSRRCGLIVAQVRIGAVLRMLAGHRAIPGWLDLPLPPRAMRATLPLRELSAAPRQRSSAVAPGSFPGKRIPT